MKRGTQLFYAMYHTKIYCVLPKLSADDITAGTRPERADVISYAKSIHITVRLQTGTTKGEIFPPYVTVEYGSASSSDYDSNSNVEVINCSKTNL